MKMPLCVYTYTKALRNEGKHCNKRDKKKRACIAKRLLHLSTIEREQSI